MMEQIQFYAALVGLGVGPLLVILSLLVMLLGSTMGSLAMLVFGLVMLLVGAILVGVPYYWFISAT